MARTRTRQPEPEVDETTNGERDWSNLKDKDTTWMHEAFAEFIEDESGIKVPPKHVQAVTAMRVAFRQSDLYKEAKAEAKAEREEAEPEPEPAPKPATRSRRSRKGKTEPEVTVAKDEPKPATRSRRTRAAKAEEEAPKPAARRSRRTRAAKTEEPSTTPEAPF